MTVPKVLIVDDSTTMRFQAGAMLPQETQIFEAEDGIQGIQKILKLRPDLILLDCFMPRMNGWQVINRMLSYPEVSHLPVVLITGYKKELDKSAPQLFDYFIYDYFELLGKPFDQESLFTAIEKAVEKAQKRYPNQTFFDPQFLTQPELFMSESFSVTLAAPSSQSNNNGETVSSTTPIKLAPIKLEQLPSDPVDGETLKRAELRQERNRTGQASQNSSETLISSPISAASSETTASSAEFRVNGKVDVAMQLQLLQAEMRTLRQRNDILMQEVNQLKQQVGRLSEKS